MDEKAKKIDEIYDEYEQIVRNNIVRYTTLFTSVFVIISLTQHVNNPLMISIPIASILVVPPILSTRDFNKNIRNFKKEHKGYHFPDNVLKIDKQHKKEVKKIQKEQREIKNDYIKKCEEVKREVTSPVHADLYYYEGPEKVKVKVKKR